MASNRFGFFGLSGIIPENFKECTQNCIWEVFFYDKPTDYTASLDFTSTFS